MRLLKLELAPPMTQGVEEETPMQVDIPMVDMTMDNYESPCECAERIRSDVLNMILDAMNNHEEYYDHIDEIKEMYQDWQSHECQEILEWAEGTEKYGDWCKNNMSETDQMKYTGEPMDIAMQLLKEEVPYGSRDYPPQEIAVSTGTPLMGSKNSGPAPEVCNMPGCESGLPPVIYRRMANPIRSIDNHEFMCEQCAYKNDMQSLLYHKMLKGEITLADFAMRLLKEEPLHLRNSAELAELARQGDIEAYNEMMERTDDYYSANEITGEPDIEANLEAYGAETGKNPFKTPPIGRTNQIQIHQRPVTPIHADKKIHNWQYKNASEPMEIAMQLLKERVSPEAKRHKLEYDKKYESSPERVKYREELNRERRRRHIMGQGGPDMSHTKDHTIVPEDSHTNRARHFKDKGTLL